VKWFTAPPVKNFTRAENIRTACGRQRNDECGMMNDELPLTVTEMLIIHHSSLIIRGAGQ
jgi:hypothetical protein